jgi:hypothetical protein
LYDENWRFRRSMAAQVSRGAVRSHGLRVIAATLQRLSAVARRFSCAAQDSSGGCDFCGTYLCPSSFLVPFVARAAASSNLHLRVHLVK